jgi:microcystin-dependent protein
MGIVTGQTIATSDFRGMIFPYAGSSAPTGFLLCDGSAVSRTTYADLFALISTAYGVGDGLTTFNVPNLAGRFPLGYASSAPTKTFTFSSRSSNTITVTGADNHAHNELQTGQAVLYDTTSGAITGLVDNTTYYLIRIAYNQFQLATSVANANAGTAITLSSDGSGTQTFTATYTARSMGQTGGEEIHALRDAEMPSHTHDAKRSSGGDNNADRNETYNSNETYDGTFETSFWMRDAGSDTPHNNLPLFTVVNYIIKT